MNINARYKFVDECKDKFDKILELIDLDGDPDAFKDEFFKQVGGLAVANMFKSLSPESQESIKPVLKGVDKLAVLENFVPLFNESDLSNIYTGCFLDLVNNMIKGPNFDPIRQRIQDILSDYKL